MNKHGINTRNLNTQVSPKKDFYEFACGGWIKNNPIPDEHSSYGQFEVLREKSRKQVQDLILGLSDDPESEVKGSVAQKIKDLYNMGMDEKRLNEEGAKPLLPTLDALHENIEKKDFTSLLSWLHSGLDSAFFSSGVGPDPADSNKNILHVGETGLTLGDRDYYLEENDTNKKIIEAFERYVKKLLTLAGFDETKADDVWNIVIRIEKELAKIKMKREDLRNPILRHNIYSLEKLQKEFGFIHWKRYFNELGIENPEFANVSSVAYMQQLGDIINSLDKRELENFLIYNLITNSSGLMSDDFTDANFELFGKVMSGSKEKKPRWKRSMGLVSSMFAEAVGELYVKKYFPEENKAYMLNLVENLRKALDSHISQLDWMGAETKQKAKEKLAQMNVKIGYPDKWKDYSEIEINPEESYLENTQKASIWFTKDNYAKLNKPVDKTEWHMAPQTVNAYYSPIANEICFPAAILQPPFFDITADDALNYGAIGVVIGHEMTHGFDDQGRQFDKNGNLTDWWTAKDAESFNKLADVLVEQFNKVEVAPGVFANGKFTLGENIADQGGLNVAITAYNSTNPDDEEIEGFSPMQRFFLSYANVWANSIREEEILSRTKSDPHSLPKNRVNVTLKNIEDFEKTFDIEEGDDMFRPKNERVIIW